MTPESDSSNMKRKKPYWSGRQGKSRSTQPFDLARAMRMFGEVVGYAERNDWFQQAFGYCCVDAGDVPGDIGGSLENELDFDLQVEDVWPPQEHIDKYDQDLFLDVVEWVHDHISQGIEDQGRYHSWGDCGWHYEAFDGAPAKAEYRRRVNRVLQRFGDGYESGKTAKFDTGPRLSLLLFWMRLWPDSPKRHLPTCAKRSTPVSRSTNGGSRPPPTDAML